MRTPTYSEWYNCYKKEIFRKQFLINLSYTYAMTQQFRSYKYILMNSQIDTPGDMYSNTL